MDRRDVVELGVTDVVARRQEITHRAASNFFNYSASRNAVTDKVYHYGLSAIGYWLLAVGCWLLDYLRLTTHDLRLTEFPTHHPDDTLLTSGRYLAEFVRFTMAKDGTWIDDFTCCPRDRDRW
jgi:hypothetical protein